MTIGQVPVEVCELVTLRLASAVQASVICRLPGKASSAATVVTAAGAAPTAHPSQWWQLYFRLQQVPDYHRH